MLSILIPVYNYSIFNLVTRLHKEALGLNIAFEIRIQEDASNLFLNENQNIAHLKNISYQVSKENIGRTATRQALATQAKFDNLLFLDADVLPVKENFLEVFLKYKEDAEIIIGGIEYENNLPDTKYSLRWKFGRERETKTIAERNKNPYLSIISACIFIKKTVFLTANKNSLSAYGMDVYFSYQLKKNGICVKHIDNPIYHLGLETNDVFLPKSLRAIDTLILLDRQDKIPSDYSKIQRAYSRLQKYNAANLVSNILSRFSSFFENNLKSSNPKLLYFDLYRLSYYLKQKHA